MDYEISTSDMGRAGGWVDGIGGVKNKQKDGGAAVLLASDRDGLW